MRRGRQLLRRGSLRLAAAAPIGDSAAQRPPAPACGSISSGTSVAFSTAWETARLGVAIASRLFWAVVLASAVACHSDRTPDLGRLYAPGMEAARTPPVILIPGALGSRLLDKSRSTEVWPGSTLRLLAGSKQDLALPFDAATLRPIDDGLEAGGLFEEILNADFYGAIVRTLRESGRFVPGKLGVHADPKARQFYVFAYDWRQDNVTTAKRLDALIEQIRRDYDDPTLKVNVIAHSMGGLITRYYLRYGTVDALEGDGDFPSI